MLSSCMEGRKQKDEDAGGKTHVEKRKRIRRNGTGKYTVRSVEREFVANKLALFLGMVV
ncbi:hypothetical protein B0H12DRAFT_1130947 [Mycena haematopus]|nr:hypothetical protein B0H12DRAFT_1130947 [Mycena haematopus]